MIFQQIQSALAGARHAVYQHPVLFVSLIALLVTLTYLTRPRRPTLHPIIAEKLKPTDRKPGGTTLSPPQ